MATATQDMAAPSGLVVPRGTVTESLVTKVNDIYDPKDGWIAKYNVERIDEIELLALAVCAGVDALFLGDPGVGKTWMIELQLRTFRTGGKPLNALDLFNTLMFKEMSANDVLGPPNIDKLKQGVIERMIAGFLPTARIGYLDEFFKSSPTVINALLDIMANRYVKIGGKLVSVKQLLVIYGSSNELPDREDLAAARDRWGITKFVHPVRTDEGRKEVMDIQDQYQAGGSTVDMTDMPTLELEEVDQIRAETAAVIVPDPVRETLAEAEEKWEQAGHLPSQRRMGQILRVAKARAWMHERGEMTSDDLVVAQHMAWNLPDHADSARQIIMELSNEFNRRAARMHEALEPITTEISELRSELANLGVTAPEDELLERVYKVKRDLRRLEREAKEEVKKGKSQAQDTSELEKVRTEINRNQKWVDKVMLDEDDDDGDED
jgi:MoxR-like ATPase